MPKHMQRILLLQWLLLPFIGIAQPGFNNTCNFGYFGNRFENIIVCNDTIVAYGAAFSDSFPHKQCLFVARFDSSGTPLDHTLICDSLGGDLTMAINWSDIVVTSDGGYALTAASFDRYDGMFVKLRHDLSVEFIQEYPDSVNLVEFYNSIVELSDGYLLGGSLQRPNYLLDGFLRRVDKQGNPLWFSYYGDYEMYDAFTGHCKFNDSLIIYTGSYQKNANTVNGRGPWLNLINPDGEVIKEWRPNGDTLPIDGILNLLPVSPDKWVIYGMNIVSANPSQYQPYIARIDTSFQIEAVRPFDPVRPTLSFLQDIEPTLDGNFIGAGQFTANNPNVEPDIYGRLFKFSPDLDSLWSLQLTAPIPNVQQSGNYLGGVGVLSSGNMVAGGYAQSGNDIRCWLVKFTPDGCVDTLWCVTTSAWEPVETQAREAGLLLWPNPTAGSANLRLPEANTDFRGFLYDVLGQLVSTFEIPSAPAPSDYLLETSHLAPGAYWVVLHDGKGRFWLEKVIRY